MSQTGQTILALVTPSAHSVPLGTETLVHWEAYRLHLGVSLLLIFFLKYRPFSISALRPSLNSPTNKCARNSCPTKFFAFSFLLLSTELPFTPLPLRLCLCAFAFAPSCCHGLRHEMLLSTMRRHIKYRSVLAPSHRAASWPFARASFLPVLLPHQKPFRDLETTPHLCDNTVTMVVLNCTSSPSNPNC